MSNEMWRWADPEGQQRKVQLDELRAGLASGLIAPNTPIWRSGWKQWQPAHEVPELTTSALSAANGIVQNIPPPPLAVVAVQHAFESKGADSFRPPPVAPIDGDEPPPPPPYIPAATRVPSAPGSSPSGVVSLPTTVGLPPPPEIAALAAQKGAARGMLPSKPPPPRRGEAAAEEVDVSDDIIEELSGSILLDAPSTGALPSAETSGSLPPPTDPVVHPLESPSLFPSNLPPRPNPLDQLKKDIQNLRAGRPAENKRLLIVAGVVGGSALLVVLATFISLIRAVAGSGDAPAGSASAVASVSPPEVQSAAPTPSVTAAPTPVVATPKETVRAPAAVLGDCAAAGDAKPLGWRALVPSGVEAAAVPGALAVGFASNPREGVALLLDPSSLAPTTTVKGRAVGGDAKRVTPLSVQGKTVIAVVDTDRGNDKLRSRRVAFGPSPIDVGVADGAIVWAPHGKDSWAKLFALDGDAPVEALRTVPLANSKGVGIAFRRSGAIWVGAAQGEGVLEAQGTLQKIAGLGQVGSPSIAASGDSLVIAWADRGGAQDPWAVRWTKVPVGGAPAEPRTLALPEGGLGEQAMSPSVAGLGGGRFLVAWTEGPVANHQVRAQTIGPDGSPSGAVIGVSPNGLNAGQPQAAVGPDGKGLVAFLAVKGKGYEVHATPVACPAK